MSDLGMEVFSMATTILFLIVVLLAITIFPWIGNMEHTGLHHTDLMAGDEGED
jgi:hypothetical protein